MLFTLFVKSPQEVEDLLQHLESHDGAKWICGLERTEQDLNKEDGGCKEHLQGRRQKDRVARASASPPPFCCLGTLRSAPLART